jgi:TetR/AcrR family transcriptional regulator, transcriptional repressor for nem operon
LKISIEIYRRLVYYQYMLQDIQSLTRTHGARKQSLQSTRDRLIAVGLQKVLEGGWSATSIDVVLRECEVPKGSFYHYFASKEVFGYALLDSYQAFFMQRLTKWFVDQPTDGLAQLQAAMDGFLADSIVGIERYGYRRGCLVGALGQEVAGLHEGFRAKLLESLQYWDKTLASALFNCASSYQNNTNKGSKNSKTTGLLPMQNAPQNAPQTWQECEKLAQEFWAWWEGAVLRSLLAQNPDMLRAAVHRFMGQFAFWLTGLEHRVQPSKPAAEALAGSSPHAEGAPMATARLPFTNKSTPPRKSKKPDKSEKPDLSQQSNAPKKSSKSLNINNLQADLNF